MNTNQNLSPENLISEFVEWIDPLEALETISTKFVDSPDSEDHLMINCLNSLFLGMLKLESNVPTIKGAALLRKKDECFRTALLEN